MPSTAVAHAPRTLVPVDPNFDDEMDDGPGTSAPDTYSLSLELQERIVHNVLCDRLFFLETMNMIQPNYFGDLAYSRIVRLQNDYFRGKYSGVDEAKSAIDHRAGHLITRAVLEHLVTMELGHQDDEEELVRELGIIDRIYDAAEDSIRDRDYLFEQTTRFAREQGMKNAIMSSVGFLAKGDFAAIEKTIQEALMIGPQLSLGQFYFEDAEERYGRILSADESADRFTCVFRDMDEDLRGGLKRKELGMVFAGPGIGKSIYLANIARTNVLAGRKVLYITLEVSSDISAERLDAGFTQVPFDQLRTQSEHVIEKLKILGSVHQGSLVIQEFPNGTLSMSDLRAYLAQLWAYRSWRPDVIVIDYLDEMAPIKGLDEYESQQRLTRQLRGFAVQEGFLIWTATQVNRSGRQTKIAKETEIGESWGKVKVVDLLLSLNQTDEQKQVGVMEAYLVKNRNGRSRYAIPVRIDYRTFVMEQMSQDEFSTLMMGGNIPRPEIESNPDTGDTLSLDVKGVGVVSISQALSQLPSAGGAQIMPGPPMRAPGVGMHAPPGVNPGK